MIQSLVEFHSWTMQLKWDMMAKLNLKFNYFQNPKIVF